ncbi:MAG: hypothetical protein ACE5MM_00260 [Nitrospiraceae bacterium]
MPTGTYRGLVRFPGFRSLLVTQFLGALLQLDVILLGKEVMALDDTRIGLLQAAVVGYTLLERAT